MPKMITKEFTSRSAAEKAYAEKKKKGYRMIAVTREIKYVLRYQR